jgi:chromosome segregation ATPase
MKKITFKKLCIQNFLSVGDEPLEIEFNSGLNVITGYNRDENDIKNRSR